MLALLHGEFPNEILHRDFFRTAGGAGSTLDAILRPGRFEQRFFFLMPPVCFEERGDVDARRTHRFASSTVCAGTFGSHTESDWASFGEAAQRFTSECPIEFIRATGSAAEDIADDAIGHGYQVIYLDYVQLLSSPNDRNSSEYEKVTRNSQTLKRFAQSQGVATVELAQLHRPETSGKDRKLVPPDMHSFKESGQLEQDADIALLLWPSDRNDNTSNRRLKIGKNKEGGRAIVDLRFQPGIQTMTELIDEDDPGHTVQRDLIDRGRHVKAENRRKAQQPMEGQQQFSEADIPDEDNPFK